MGDSHKGSDEQSELAIRRWCDDCPRDSRLKTIEDAMQTIQIEQTKLLAVLGFWKWALPILVTVAVFLGGVVERRLMASPHVAPAAQVQGK